MSIRPRRIVQSAKKALILGGTRGLGRAIAEQIRYKGIQPIIAGRTASSEQAPLRNFDTDDTQLPPPMYIRLDFSDIDSIETATEGLELLHLGPIQHVFWVAGIGLRGDIESHLPEEIARLYQTLIVGPSIFFNKFNQIYKDPYHLITVASTTALKIRKNETIYATAKGAQARFAVNFHEEMTRTRPGFKSTIVFPGGMNTGFFEGTDVDPTGFMDPRRIASEILGQTLRQQPEKLYLVLERIAQGGIAGSFPLEPPMQW